MPTDEVATHTAAAGFDTGTGYELQLTSGLGVSSGSVDIFRAEGSDEVAYSLPVTIAYDPEVSSGSENQVRAVSVGPNGQDLVLRWSLHEQNGKDFRVYFEDAETGSIALLTAAGLPGGTTDSFGSEVPGLFHFEVDPIWPCPGGEDPPPAPEETFVDRFHHRDHLGSLRVVTDEAGWKIPSGELDFYPFGLQIGSHDGKSRREYTGHERDEQTGLDYMMARYKQTCSPRFTSPDPIFDTSLAAPTTWNRYAYVHGDPVNRLDPTGLAGFKDSPNVILMPIEFPGIGTFWWPVPGFTEEVNVTDSPFDEPAISARDGWFEEGSGGGPGNGPRGGGGGFAPMAYADHLADSVDTTPLTDKDALVRFCDYLAASGLTNREFAIFFGHALSATTPLTFESVSTPDLAGRGLPRFAQSGFAPRFQDAMNGNQVGHYAGAFVAGYYFGERMGPQGAWLGIAGNTVREVILSRQSQYADVLLGNVAAVHGAMLAGGGFSQQWVCNQMRMELSP